MKLEEFELMVEKWFKEHVVDKSNIEKELFDIKITSRDRKRRVQIIPNVKTSPSLVTIDLASIKGSYEEAFKTTWEKLDKNK